MSVNIRGFKSCHPLEFLPGAEDAEKWVRTEIEGRNHLAQPLMKGGKGLDSPCNWFVSPFYKGRCLRGSNRF